jgi:hypothetical protein
LIPRTIFFSTIPTEVVAGVITLTLLSKVAGVTADVAAEVAVGVTALMLLPKVVGAAGGKVHDQRDWPIGGDS